MLSKEKQEKLVELMWRRATVTQAAAELGCNFAAAQRWAKKLCPQWMRPKYQRANPSAKKAEHAAEIAERKAKRAAERGARYAIVGRLRGEGKTLKEIGAELGVTVERARQIVAKHFPELDHRRWPPSQSWRNEKRRQRMERVARFVEAIRAGRSVAETLASIGLHRVWPYQCRQFFPADVLEIMRRERRAKAAEFQRNAWLKNREKILASRQKSAAWQNRGEKIRRLWADPEWRARALTARKRTAE